MGWYERFFIDAAASVGHVHGTHHLGLVLLSLCVSIFSATMALQTAQIARHTESVAYRNVAVITGAIALGGGIWTMHFIGMLSFQLPASVTYATDLTLLSLVPACLASWFALRLLVSPTLDWRRLIFSGTLVGLGIGTMHYTGMAAMQTPLLMRYEPVTFVLSVVLAVVLAILALWVRFGLRRLPVARTHRFLLSGLVMGLAIGGMHYTGMAAVRFQGEAGTPEPGLVLDTTIASLALSTFTVTVTVLVVALSALMRARELYRKVEDSKSKLRATLDTAIDGIITIDSQGIIQGFNHSAERLFGWQAEEVIGHNIKMLMPEPDQSRHDGYLRNYLTSGQAKVIGVGREVMGLRKDGTLLPMRLGVGRVDLPNELLFVGFVTDISERHKMEASLRETAERAEQAAAAKSTFLANMSHEIRTPMNSIIGFTELLLQGDLTPVQRNHLNTVRQSSRSLLALINDILDTTRMERGKLDLEAIDFSLKGLALQIESSLRLGARARNLSLQTYYPADMPEYFKGDPLRILQVLTNLIGNAIKFTEKGGVTVVFSHTDGIVHAEVRDTGIGMSPQQTASIFTPFTQADASISRRFGGTGLGTSIARQLVELMHGRIEVESTLGQGSTFHVWLPLAVGQRPADPLEDAERVSLPPLRILIADDVPQNLELLALTLTGNGHQVATAGDGDEAVKKFMEARFDVLLMDVHMPGTDGLQATRLIRQFERVHGRIPTPVIALTASVMADDRRSARQAGMDGFAVKPLDVPRLFEEIAKVLNLSGSAPSPVAVAPVPARPLIDWQKGAQLWGSEERLASALGQFLASQATQHPLPEPDSVEIDWPRARLSLHGIRGAVGNLALPGVAELAGEIEQHILAGEHVKARGQLVVLQGQLAEAVRLLALRKTAQPAAMPAPVATSPEWQDELTTLLAVVHRNELDDAALEAVCLGLKLRGQEDVAQALRRAIESFEFAQAQTLLDTLMADAGQTPAMA